LSSLNRLFLLSYAIDPKATVTRLPKTDARQKEILAALRISIPEKQAGVYLPIHSYKHNAFMFLRWNSSWNSEGRSVRWFRPVM